MSWGKSDQDRIQDTLNYVAGVPGVSKVSVQLLVNYVNGDSIFSAATISKALSLGFSRFGRGGTTKSQRHAIRGLILTKLAATLPPSTAVAKSWKAAYKRRSESKLQRRIAHYLLQLQAPRPIPSIPTGGTTGVAPAAYGISDATLQAAIGSLATKPTAATATSVTAPGPPPGAKQAFAAKKSYFEKVSRSHVILSGHGSWPTPFAMVRLKTNQKMRFYSSHGYPVGNNYAQLIDSRQFPAPVEERTGGETIWDYMLHPKRSLKLMNHSNGDRRFLTVTTDTPISAFINNPAYVDATFHFAACRVVTSGRHVWCPVDHGKWEPYVKGGPKPCVLK
ncbi:putative adhesin [Fuerstiella marisgermanici]|uniref:Putative adhesin Stv domain-containing protein n=1 Tax=Fuerstiella marisgermanici TaxID=1891926 RepID=A0A1P8WR97_9PLAN|nr:hypothetical protein [Fuerstiella marisgermanici]APZ96592.1 hypothetical protein Fuma_06262 [Fuerstiella marisgermanici]